MTRGCGAVSFLCHGCISTSSRPRGLRGSAPLTVVPVGMKASSPFEDQDLRLAPPMTAPDDKVPAAVHGPGLPRRVPNVCRASGGIAHTYFSPAP